MKYLYVIHEMSSTYGKYGICSKDNISRLFDGQTYYKNKIIIDNLYEISEKDNYQLYKNYDNIITFIGKDLNKIKQVESFYKLEFKYLKLLNNYLINGNGGTELFNIDGLDTLNNFINNELSIFGLNVNEKSREYIDDLIEENKQKNSLNDKINNDIFNKIFGKKINELELYIKPKGIHQIELYNDLNNFKQNKLGQLIWCCGLGKTFMSLMICYKLNLKKILICVPSIYLLKQFKKSIKEAFHIEKPICLYGQSDNKQDIDKLNNNDDIIIVLSTYHSCKKVLDVTNKKKFTFDIKIGDEAHHLVTSNNEDDKYTFDKFHKINSEYTLFMTATRKEIINGDNTYTMSNEEQFGPIIDCKNINWAIKNKYITNYDIVCIMNSNDEIDNIYESIDFKLICRDDIKCNKKELFFAGFNALKCINDGMVTHLLVYTNKQETADIVEKIINILINKNIFENINNKMLYNKSLHSNSNIKLEEQVEKFKNKTFGIISCVFIFGEGFDLPKLNGVVIGEKMTSDIRIVQSCLRPNRLEKDNPNKKAYIIIPTNINNIDDKIKIVISNMIKEDENIIQKIKFVKTKKGKSILREISSKKIKINNCKETLARLKLNLFNNGCLGNSLNIMDEYKYSRDLIKRMKFNSVKEYMDKNFPGKIENADSHFYKIWNNWFDYLSIDTSKWIKDKYDFINYCKNNNIRNTNDYYKYIDNHECLPPEPEYFYNNFTNLNDELGHRKYIYFKRN
jgi:superfamily II DNA or RNA helicase